jgi:hypothetical protein
MTVVEREKVEDCFDGSAVYLYRFDGPLRLEDVARLESMGGVVRAYLDFPRPFFRVRTPLGLEMKGIVGERQCRVILPATEREETERRFEKLWR